MSIGLKGLVGLGIVLIFCVIGLSVAQDKNFDSAKEEEILRSICPTEDELLVGIELDHREYDITVNKGDNPENVCLRCYIRGERLTQCPDPIVPQRVGFYGDCGVDLYAWNPKQCYPSPESFYKSFRSVSDKYEIYDGLPVALITDYGNAEHTAYTYNIYFWKSPAYGGHVHVGLGADPLNQYGCTPTDEERAAGANAYARSECERLAKLAYDRLPGDVMIKPEYEKLCKVLIAAGYDEKLWGDKVNATKALDSYAGPEDFGYPTNGLINRMLPEIEAVDEMAKRADIDCDQPLYDGMSSWTDIIRPFLPSIGGFAEQFDSTIKGYNNLKTLCEVVQASGKCLTDMVFEGIVKYAYDGWVSAGAENNVGAVIDAFVKYPPRTLLNTSGGPYYGMSEEQFYNLMQTKFTAKRACELSKAELEFTKKNKALLITKIINQNERNIQKIERSIEEIQKTGIVPKPDLPFTDTQEDSADDEQEYTTDDSYGSGDSSWQDSWSGLTLDDYAAMNEQGVQ